MTQNVLQLSNVNVIREGKPLLQKINWQVRNDQHWIILGPNGSGKTTLCQLASLYLHPSNGNVDVLGERLGQTDVRELRKNIGFTSSALQTLLNPMLRVEDIVISAKDGALAPWWHSYTPKDRQKARGLLDLFGCTDLEQRFFKTLSSGEKQRVLLARTLMNDPALWILDEPMRGLDLGGREKLIERLGLLTSHTKAPSTILVTHHVEEIPEGFTHALLLANGQIVISGELAKVLTEDSISECFGLRLTLNYHDGRWRAQTKKKSSLRYS
tara:strand:- start:44714 stop:45523 length:810 start_codon:yes stop_codon:yes gene_type:complete